MSAQPDLLLGDGPGLDVSYNPRTGEGQGEVAHTPPPEVARLVTLAARAAPGVAATAPALRSGWLHAIADALEERQEQLAALADQETALGLDLLRGEVARAAAQARFYAEVAVVGGLLDVAIDALPDGTDLRRVRLPTGPVAVFGASNFPLAFGVCGHDTSSAIAAGCPVLVKAHPAHPRLSVGVAELIQAVLARQGAPVGTFALVVGLDAGLQLVDAPQVSAVAFTGSERGGMAIAARAAARPSPVPVFAEMGTVNPVVVTPARHERGWDRCWPDSPSRSRWARASSAPSQDCCWPPAGPMRPPSWLASSSRWRRGGCSPPASRGPTRTGSNGSATRGRPLSSKAAVARRDLPLQPRCCAAVGDLGPRPSGSGKSTFLRCINHLVRLDGGEISVNGELVGYRRHDGKKLELRRREVVAARRHVGMVFQRFNLFPHRTAAGNIMEAPIFAAGNIMEAPIFVKHERKETARKERGRERGCVTAAAAIDSISDNVQLIGTRVAQSRPGSRRHDHRRARGWPAQAVLVGEGAGPGGPGSPPVDQARFRSAGHPQPGQGASPGFTVPLMMVEAGGRCPLRWFLRLLMVPSHGTLWMLCCKVQ